MLKKIHNPRSHAPAVYIPCWLIQIPNNLLSFAAKCLYGRLTQWSNEKGDVFRSYNQLAQEIGSTKRSINEYLRELRECGLIGTMHPQAGGLNHFVFYDHEWMREDINQFLTNKSYPDPEQDSALPRAGFCSTPEQDSARINIKEIKEIKDIDVSSKTSVDNSFSLTIKTMLEDNPHVIEKQMIEEWMHIRKRKKAPLTPIAWSHTNNVMAKLADKGLNPRECFERMVASGWQGMELKYFEQELKQDRAANEQKIREREFKAQEEKRKEIAYAKKFAVKREPGRPEGLTRLRDAMGIFN